MTCISNIVIFFVPVFPHSLKKPLAQDQLSVLSCSRGVGAASCLSPPHGRRDKGW